MDDAYLARMDQVLEAAFAQYPNFLRPMLDPRKAASVPWLSSVARTKRFLEWRAADDKLRVAIDENATAAIEGMNLGVDPDEIRYIWDEDFNKKKTADRNWVGPEAVQQYRTWCCEKLRFREKTRRESCVPSDPRHKAWRERQMARTLGELGASFYENIVHAPVTIELSEGCSVGCWFCGVSADRKKSDFPYEGNAEEWKEILGVISRLLGPSAGQGFLYWGTDPLDNPDYEKFALDFAHICGRFPQTTTAQAQKHIERVRALLKLSAENGCEINRFSVLSIGAFKKILAAFTPEELLHTELVLQNREGENLQSNSGRARGNRELEKRAVARDRGETYQEEPGTISCVSGFHLNMVRRSIKLITPCACSDKWPDGHWILEKTTFKDAQDLERIMIRMMERYMPTTLRAGDRVRLRADIKATITPEHVKLASYGMTTKIADMPHIQQMAPLVIAGDRTAGEIAIEMEDRHGWPAEKVMSTLNWLFDQGLLDEEPRPATVVAPPAALSRVKETAS